MGRVCSPYLVPFVKCGFLVHIVNNFTSKLVTTARSQVSLSTNFQSDVFEGTVELLLTFEGDQCTITAPADAPYTVSGTGLFKSDAYEWGNKPRNGIELSYTISDGNHTYEAEDVLVVRDRGVVLEVYNPETYDN